MTDLTAVLPQPTNPWLIAPQVRRHNGLIESVFDRELGVYLVYDSDGRLASIWDEKLKDIKRPELHGPTLPPFATLHLMADRDEAGTHRWVYFIGDGEGMVKIGFSSDPDFRLRQMQSHSPVIMRVLAKRRGGALREAAYHAQFAEHRVRGEWFSPAPAILEEIDRLRDTPNGH